MSYKELLPGLRGYEAENEARGQCMLLNYSTYCFLTIACNDHFRVGLGLDSLLKVSIFHISDRIHEGHSSYITPSSYNPLLLMKEVLQEFLVSPSTDYFPISSGSLVLSAPIPAG